MEELGEDINIGRGRWNLCKKQGDEELQIFHSMRGDTKILYKNIWLNGNFNCKTICPRKNIGIYLQYTTGNVVTIISIN